MSAQVRIEHVALWTGDLERLRRFYENSLGGRASALYRNEAKEFASYFVEFDGGPRLELMQSPRVDRRPEGDGEALGYAHIAFSLGSEAAVDELTSRLEAAGHVVADRPRRTGDGYYESVVLDPDGNRVELTV